MLTNYNIEFHSIQLVPYHNIHNINLLEAEKDRCWLSNISETRLPASLMVSLSNCIIGESFIETHSRPLEAVGLLDLSESEYRIPFRYRDRTSESTDRQRFLSPKFWTSWSKFWSKRPYRSEAMTLDSLRLRLILAISVDFLCLLADFEFLVRGGGWGCGSLSEVDLCLVFK